MNSYFGLKRFSNLYRLWWFRNHNTSMLYLAAFCGATILFTIWFVWIITDSFQDFSRWDTSVYIPLHIFLFITIGVLYAGSAFPGFRSKEKTLEYLLLPSTTLEKFSFEWLNRVLFIVIFFPLIFSFLINLTTNGIAFFYDDFTDSRADVLWLLTEMSPLEISLFAFATFTAFNISFLGSSYFQGKPVIKTLLSVFVYLTLMGSYTYFMVQILDLENRVPENDCFLFVCSKEGLQTLFIILGVVLNLLLMGISFLKLKEKEV